MDDLSRYKIRAKIAIGVVSVIAAAVYLLFARAIQPSDELAARFLRYVLDGGGKVYRPDGTVREITREAIDKISVTDCRVWNRKAEVHICAMRFSDKASAEYLTALEAAWDRGSALTNVDSYRVVSLPLERQQSILIERGMLRP
ncbi:MAG TPA: hypothetical protein VGX71_22435 [Pseudaminobacter sp.]|jgi:hypothetical protein|nr:hypothetical protein [Pseudaminobacter sp.]